ncbi:MAG: hypothetical protein AB1331_07125 [Bacillota bacterium]
MDTSRILLDIDGTIGVSAIRELLNAQTGINLSEEDITDYRITRHYGMSEEEDARWWWQNHLRVFETTSLLCRHAPAVLARLRQQESHIYIVTARRHEARPITEAWLRQSFIPFDELIMNADDKVAIARSLGLTLGFEDHPETAQRLAQLLPVFLFDWPYNRQVPPSANLIRVTDWREVEQSLAALGRLPA